MEPFSVLCSFQAFLLPDLHCIAPVSNIRADPEGGGLRQELKSKGNMPGTGSFFCGRCHTLGYQHFNLYLEAVQQTVALAQFGCWKDQNAFEVKNALVHQKEKQEGQKDGHVCVLCVLTSIYGLQVPSWAALREVNLD